MAISHHVESLDLAMMRFFNQPAIAKALVKWTPSLNTPWSSRWCICTISRAGFFLKTWRLAKQNRVYPYIHWPFCRQKCPYCDFNSHVSATHDSARWHRALSWNVIYGRNAGSHRALTSIFFGGGTPSLMPPAVIDKIIAHAEKTFGFAPMIEITAKQINICQARCDRILLCGVNRISMGINLSIIKY